MVTMRAIKSFSKRLMEGVVIVGIQKLGNNKDFAKIIQDKLYKSK
jgi:hypothetical protein